MKGSNIGKLGVSGSVHGCTESQLRVLESYIRLASELHHGDCIGVDAQAHAIALQGRLRVVAHPPVDSKKRAHVEGADEYRPLRSYLKRNRDIAEESDIVVGFPNHYSERLRSGVFATMRAGLRAGKRVMLVTPDGAVRPFTKSRFI